MSSPTPEDDPDRLPEFVALEAALRSFVAVGRRRAELARQLKETMRQMVDPVDAQGPHDSYEEKERLLAERLRPVAEGFLEVSTAIVPATVELDAAMRSLVLRVATGELTSEQEAEAAEALDGMLKLVDTVITRGGLLGRGTHFEDDGYRDRGLQASFDQLATAFRRLDEQDDALIRLQELIYSLPGREPPPDTAVPARPVRLEELAVIDTAVTRWAGSVRGWSLATEEFYHASAAFRKEFARAAGSPDRAARKRIAAVLSQAAELLQQRVTEYAARMADLDAALQSLLVRLAADDVSPADRADAGRSVEGLRHFALGAVGSDGSASHNDWLRLADAIGLELGRGFVIAAGAFQLFQDQQPIIEGWARLPAATEPPSAES